MTPNYQGKRILAGFAVVVSAAGLLFSLSTNTMASAESVGSTASVETVPTCVWQLSGVSDTITLTHPNAASGGDSHTAYVGNDFKLSGSSAETAKIYVGPAGQSSASTSDADNCSFYNNGGLGVSNSGADAQLGIVDASNAKFIAEFGTVDPAMSFNLDGTKPTGSSQFRNLTLSITPTSCFSSNLSGGSGDNWVKESGTTGLNSGTSPISLALLSKANTTTTSTCSFSSGLSVFIPGGMTPRNPGEQYTFTGPTLTTTLSTSIN